MRGSPRINPQGMILWASLF
jgi:hypothetical protein